MSDGETARAGVSAPSGRPRRGTTVAERIDHAAEALTRDQRATLEHFTHAPDGRGVMDGDGHIWRYSASDDIWYSRTHPESPVESLTLACALAPDIAAALGIGGDRG